MFWKVYSLIKTIIQSITETESSISEIKRDLEYLMDGDGYQVVEYSGEDSNFTILQNAYIYGIVPKSNVNIPVDTNQLLINGKSLDFKGDLIVHPNPNLTFGSVDRGKVSAFTFPIFAQSLVKKDSSQRINILVFYKPLEE
ncbi:MAG: hypothetical protein UC390_07630 [Peptococcaceae bacterium]|nr:hypothetical protein [Peptococcaceae bacterium]